MCLKDQINNWIIKTSLEIIKHTHVSYKKGEMTIF